MTSRTAPGRRRPSGRRTGDSGTRDAILDAARDHFSSAGYAGASIRSIASAAGVDPALIRHFFDDKDTLFAAVVADRSTIPERITEALHGNPETIGERVTDAYLRLWEEPDTRPVLMALVRSACTCEEKAALLQETLGARMQDRIDDVGITGEDLTRLGLAATHLFGLAMARHIMKLAPIAALDHQQLVAQVAPTIQRYLSGTHL
ncbi:MAG: TetR family transcriptional regulator [Actinomycetales bacterium]